MSVAAKIGKRSIWVANGTVNVLVLLAILLLLVFSCYALWDSSQVYRAADATQYAKYKPTAQNKGLSFEELQKLNPEVFAWLTVYGTHIDYPVTQASDNLKYINTDAKGHYSLSGSIFLDCNCSKDFSDFSSIIYGHHMEKDTMFGEIGLFASKNYFDVRRYGKLYYGGQEHGLEFFAFMRADAYDSTVFRSSKLIGQSARQAYLDLLKRKSLNVRPDVTVTTDDRIVLLSTCSSSGTNERDILVGKITDKVYADPFKTAQAQKPAQPTVDRLLSLWNQCPVWARFVLAALPFLLILLAIVLTYKKKQSRKKRAEVVGEEER